MIFLWGCLSARANPIREYQVKAAFLFNFTKFIEWPAEKAGPAGAPIVIGVFGSNPFGDSLAATVRGRKVNGRPIQVRHVGDRADVPGVHVLFVPASQTRAAAGLGDAMRRGSVLGVGESPGFLDAGGSIAFGLEADKVRFDIDLRSAEAARLKTSAQLLKLARTVRKAR